MNCKIMMGETEEYFMKSPFYLILKKVKKLICGELAGKYSSGRGKYGSTMMVQGK